MPIDLDRLHQHFPKLSPHRRSGRTFASCVVALQAKEDFYFVIENISHIDSAKKVLKDAAIHLEEVDLCSEEKEYLTFHSFDSSKDFKCHIISRRNQKGKSRGLDGRAYYDHFSLQDGGF